MISVAEAAKRLDVGVQRVHQRIADGSLPAVRVGSQWVVDSASIAVVSETDTPGRPLSQRSAWAILSASQDDEEALGTLDPKERSRANERLRHLLAHSQPDAPPSELQVHASTVLLRRLFRNRAERHLFRASRRDLPDLRKDDRLRLSGLSHQASGIASGDLVEGYTTGDMADALIEDHLLSPVSTSTDANVVLHVTTSALSQGITPLLLAADLAEHRRPREEARALEILITIARQHPSTTVGQKHGKRHRRVDS